MTRARARFRSVSIAVAASLVSWVASAAPDDEARAEELFRTAKQLMAEGNHAAACPKLAESHRLDPASGTLLTLALCHEATGATASAWANFNAAIALSSRDGRSDREAIARRHAAALEPKLRRLRVRVAEEKAPDLVIERDGVALGSSEWDLAAPVDPGTHVVEARAPGRVTFRASIETGPEGAIADVVVPALAPLAGEGPAPPPPVAPAEVGAPARVPPPRWASYGAAGLGVVAGALGAYFSVATREKQDEADRLCPAKACTNPHGVDLSHEAATRADLATASFIVAGACIASAAVLFVMSLRSGHPQRQAMRGLSF